ncbi:MAG: hypothetical protein ABH884_00035 [Candidatus Komeilibacteria bacterium]
MSIIMKVFIVTIISLSFFNIAQADTAPPETQTTFYFQKDGQAFTQPVEFTISCFSSTLINNDELKKTSEMTEICQTYGCKYDTTNVIRQGIKYCELVGEVNGEEFVIKDLLNTENSKRSCSGSGWGRSTGSKYYLNTQEYTDCWRNVRKEYYPNGDGSAKGGFLCHDFFVEAPKRKCKGGPGYMSVNGTCYEITSEAKACFDQKDQKEQNCRQYLEDVTDKLDKDKNGRPFGALCEMTIDMIDRGSDSQFIEEQKIKQNQAEVKALSFYTRTINFFKDTFQKLFRKFF